MPQTDIIKTDVLRAISSSALSVVLLIGLMWGGCISCPQFFMFPTAKKSCCNKGGQCERPTKNTAPKECKRMPLEHQSVSSSHVDLAASSLPGEPLHLIPVVGAVSLRSHGETLLVEHSPPDLTVLNSTFLI